MVTGSLLVYVPPSGDLAARRTKLGSWFLIEVLRSGVINSFQIVEAGRRTMRSMCYTSNVIMCMHDMEQDTDDREKDWVEGARHAAGRLLGEVSKAYVEAAKNARRSGEYGSNWGRRKVVDVGPTAKVGSVIIARTRQDIGDAVGPEIFVPGDFLHGLIPDALLEEYEFWQSVRNSAVIRGYAIDDTNHTFLVVRINKDNAKFPAVVTKWPTDVLQATASGSAADDPRCLQLVNISAAAPGSVLGRLAAWCCRLDHVSQVLVWSTSAAGPGEVGGITSVDFPRLKASFVPRRGVDGVVRLFSRDHDGKFVSDRRTPALLKQLRGVPTSVVLEDAIGQQYLLVPSLVLSRPVITANPFSTELVATATQEWGNVMKSRTFLYALHPSGTFLQCDTLSSSLYLLVLRLLTRDYLAVSRLLPACATDEPFLPDQQFMLKMLAPRDPEKGMQDMHPDAIATRLRLALVCVEAGTKPPYPIEDEFKDYVKKYNHVSTACRINLEEELALLQATGAARARQAYVDALVALGDERDQILRARHHAAVATAAAAEAAASTMPQPPAVLLNRQSSHVQRYS